MVREGKVKDKKWVEVNAIPFPLPPGTEKLEPKTTIPLADAAAIRWPDEKTYYKMWEKAGAIDAYYIDPDARIIIFFQVKTAIE